MQNTIISKNFDLRRNSIIYVFIYNRSTFGPRTDSCGTPEVTFNIARVNTINNCLSTVRKKSRYPSKCVISNAIVVKLR